MISISTDIFSSCLSRRTTYPDSPDNILPHSPNSPADTRTATHRYTLSLTVSSLHIRGSMQRRAGGRLPAGCAKPGPRTSAHRTRSPAQRGDARERGAAGGKTVTGKSVDGIFVAHRKTRRMCSGLAECSVNFAAMDDTFISPPPPDVVPDYVWRMKPGRDESPRHWVPSHPCESPEAALSAAKRSARGRPGFWFGREADRGAFVVFDPSGNPSERFEFPTLRQGKKTNNSSIY